MYNNFRYYFLVFHRDKKTALIGGLSFCLWITLVALNIGLMYHNIMATKDYTGICENCYREKFTIHKTCLRCREGITAYEKFLREHYPEHLKRLDKYSLYMLNLK